MNSAIVLKAGLSLALLSVLAVQSSLAQLGRGTILGTITDQQGAAIPGASVVITDVDTNAEFRTVTNEQGYYTAPSLAIGNYRVIVESPGFKRGLRGPLNLQVDEHAQIDLRLELGLVTESVEVKAEAPLVETGSATVGKVIENRRISDLPLNGRNALALVFLIPSAHSTASPLSSGFVERGWEISAITINGGPSGMNYHTLDGGINQNDQWSEVNISPTVDSIQEFKAQTGTMQAEFGRTAGGVVNVVTKSGTNQFHGALYEFIRNDAIQARNTTASAKSPLRFNQYGGAIGGPVIKDKTFFFFNYEGYHYVQYSDPIGTVPTAAWRNGDFSNLRDATGNPIPIYDPRTTRPNPNGTGFIRTPFEGNMIPKDRLDAVSQNILNTFYPLPNRTPTNLFTNSNNFDNPRASAPRRSYQYIMRFDHRFSDADSLTFRYNRFDHLKYNVGLLPTTVLSRHDQSRDQNGFLRETHIFSPHTINEFIVSAVRQTYDCVGFGSNLPVAGPDAVQGGWAAKLGLPGDPIGLVPAISIGNGIQGISDSTCINYSLNYSTSEAVTYIRGRHTFKFGGDAQHLRNDFYLLAPGGNQFNFTPALTGNPQGQSGTGYGMATFVLGSVSTASADSPLGGTRVGYSYSFYAQDDWRISRRLTLNVGFRYDYQEWPQARNLAVSNFNPFAVAPGTGLLGRMEYGVDFGGSPWKPDRKDFGPRFGFAYDVSGKGKTVLRGGYGIFYPLIFYNDNYASPTGFANSLATYNPPGGNTNLPAFQFQDGLPSPPPVPQGARLGPNGFLGQAVAYDEPNKRVPMSQQWNFSVQRQLPGQWLLEVGYLGNHGTHLVATASLTPSSGYNGYDYNQLDPTYLSLGLALQQLVPNPYAGIVPGSLGASTITRLQSLRPYPYYQNITVRNPALGNFISHQAIVSAQKRLSNGFVLLVSYTKSKIIDNSISAPSADGIGTVTGALWQNGKFDRGVERGLDTADISQRLVISGVYELPFGTGKRFHSRWAFLDKISGGWQLNAIGTFSTGVPLTIRGANNNLADRPNSTGQSAKLDNPTAAKWFNTQVFMNPAIYTFGNIGRVLPDVRAPGVENYDLSLLKTTLLWSERWRLQLRAEAFNVLNHVNWGSPDVTFVPGPNGFNSSATFGTITTARDPRTFQFGLKLLF